jgi:hypothetical protein
MRLATLHVPAPVAGLNTIDNASDLGPKDAMSLVNMVAAENGLRPRLGSQAWVDGFGAAVEMRSIIPYTGAAVGGAADKLFATTTAGIFDATVSGVAGAVLLAFPIVDANSGYGESTVFVTPAGRFLVYADESNGYYLYTEGGAWAAVAQGAGGTQVSGVNPNLFAWCVPFKNRLWFVEKGSTRAWYLPLNSIYGAASQFDFGRQFTNGGQLASLYVWSMEGGQGMDDMLVAISTAGDVVVYQGTDPSLFGSFQKAGGWNVGGVPNGRRLATTFGGELLLLTSVGVVPISRLVAGRVLLSPDIQSTEKVRNLLNATMNDRGGSYGWSIVADPLDASLIITFPKLVGEVRQQFAMSLAQKGWSQYSGKPILSAKAWHRKLYFGTDDGRVMISQGYMDNVARDGTTAQASAVRFSGLTAFRNGNSAMTKRVQLLRARFLTFGAAPSIVAQARYDFDTSDVSAAPAAPQLPANAFDAGVFGTATFGGNAAPFVATMGATGIGVHVAIAFAGSAIQRCSLIGFDVSVEQGGHVL